MKIQYYGKVKQENTIMNRSEINIVIKNSKVFLEKNNFYLPPFAFWKPEVWTNYGDEIKEIIDCNLGWDITDFGSGNFYETGLFLFTLRNGLVQKQDLPNRKLYAEKIMIAEVGQVTPMHFHWNKMEDIINRGGGNLVIELYNSDPEEKLSLSDVEVIQDGVKHFYPSGTRVLMKPGESITLTPYLYHSFWAEGSKVLIGEVSLVNDDTSDNCFLEPVGRFPSIVENEKPLHLLIVDYRKYCG